jgi:hypothetical protein
LPAIREPDTCTAPMADTEDFATTLARAQSLAAARRVPEAKALLDALKAAHPGRPEPYETKADLFLKTGWHRKALAELRAAPLHGASDAAREKIVFRAMRVAHYIAATSRHPRFSAPRPQPPLAQAVVVMMIRDEADIIRPNLEHHYMLGFRNFVILLNACHDETPALVAAFQAEHPDALVCAITDPVEGYYQAAKTQAAVEFARVYCPGVRRPVSWCFIIDADEFITVEAAHGVHGLIEAAEKTGKDFIGFHLCNATSSSELDYRPNSNPYAHFDVACGSHGYINAKNAFLLDCDVTVKMGNHSLFYKGITMDRGLVAGEHGSHMIHLPYRSVAQLESKIINGGRAYAATDMDQRVGWHWRELYQRFLDEGPAVFERELADYRARTIRESRERMRFID